MHPFWVPDRLWRGKLPERFATVLIDDVTRFERITRFDLRRRPARRRLYELIMRQGEPEELRDRIDSALLVDLWDELKLPAVIRSAWQPAVDLAAHGPTEWPWSGVKYPW